MSKHDATTMTEPTNETTETTEIDPITSVVESIPERERESLLFNPSRYDGELVTGRTGKAESSTSRMLRELMQQAERDGFNVTINTGVHSGGKEGNKVSNTVRAVASRLGYKVSVGRTREGMIAFRVNGRKDDDSTNE